MYIRILKIHLVLNEQQKNPSTFQWKLCLILLVKNLCIKSHKMVYQYPL